MVRIADQLKGTWDGWWGSADPRLGSARENVIVGANTSGSAEPHRSDDHVRADRGAGFPTPPQSGSVPFELVGDLTVKEVVRRVSWAASRQLRGPRSAVRRADRVSFGDFDLRVPRVSVVLSVEDDIKLEADLVLRRGT